MQPNFHRFLHMPLALICAFFFEHKGCRAEHPANCATHADLTVLYFIIVKHRQKLCYPKKNGATCLKPDKFCVLLTARILPYRLSTYP